MEKYNDSPPSPNNTKDLESTSLLPPTPSPRESHRRKSYIYLTLFNLFIFTLSMLSLLCAVTSQRDTSSYSAAKLMDQFGIFSPAMHQISHTHTHFTLPNPLNSSIYVGTSDAVDTAWMAIAYLPDQMVSAADFAKLQKPDTAMRVRDPRTGEDGFRVGIEAFHQLHCLNLLRMATYPEYYSGLWWSDTNDRAERVRGHLDHCIEILRMNLMCFADVNVFTFHPVEGKEGFWPDYESEHVCRDFEKVRRWAVENAVPDADV